MSKRIKISIDKNRPNLSLLFHQYIHRKATERKSYGRVLYDDDDDYEDMAAYWDKMFPGWDDDSYDEGETVYPMLGDAFGLNKHKRGARGKTKHKHSKKRKRFDIDVPYSGFEENPSEYWGDDEYDDGDYQSKVIWFYPDFHYKDDRLEFNSLKAFDKYCAKEGYNVPTYVSSDIIYRYESHCCLNPQAEKEGILEVMAEDSYGNMFYEACDTSELSGD